MARFMELMLLLCTSYALGLSKMEGLFRQEGNKIIGSPTCSNCQQGTAVSISDDGNTAVIGALFAGSTGSEVTGGAYVYQRSAQGNWNQQGPALLALDANSGSVFGFEVAINGDANTILIGAPNDTAVGNSSVGAVFVFNLASDGTWSEKAKLVGKSILGGNANQGTSVGLSQNGKVVCSGGPGDGSGAGATWVFHMNRRVWTEVTKLVGSNSIGRASQGTACDVSGNGETLVSGGWTDDGGTGAVWVFALESGEWKEQAKLVPTGSAGTDVFFGTTVAIDSKGGTVVVGGIFDDDGEGAAFVFIRRSTKWGQLQKITGYPPFFGYSVDISSNGNFIAIGASSFDGNSGGAIMYVLNSGVYEKFNGVLLSGTDTAGAALQGNGVAVNKNGITVLIGGPADSNNVGAAWAFLRS